MNEFLFFTSLVILAIIFFSRHKIVRYLYDNYYIKIESEIIVYVLSVLFLIVILMGMLLDDTKQKYSHISDNYNKMRPNAAEIKEAEKKPHRWFDIDFDSIFPW